MTALVRFGVVTSIVVLLAGCAPGSNPAVTPSHESSASPTVPSTTHSIPTSCDLPTMVDTIDALGFTGAVDVTPPWEPAAGTDLKLAIDNGGIACAWGPPNTDSGVVVYWVPVDDALWAEASAVWEGEGTGAMDVAGLDEDAAYFTFVGAGVDGNEFSRWELNLRFNGLWIQVATSAWEDPTAGNAVVQTALDVATP